MKAVVTVIGKDKIGIIAAVSGKLAQRNVNILDISQTIMQDYFTMIMLVDAENAAQPLPQLQAELSALGDELGVKIHMQHEDIFKSMHRV